MAKKTKAPTGISIKRSGNTYTITWKQADTSITKQKITYKVNNEKSWGHNATLKAGVKSHKLSFNSPVTLYFAVAACRSGYSYSSWGKAEYVLKAPPKPGWLNYENSTPTSGMFSWGAVTGDEHRIFSTYYWESGYAEGEGGPVYTEHGSTTNTSVTVSESDISGVHRRWFRVRAQGPGGNSDWTSISHIYGLPPLPSVEHAAARQASASAYDITVGWTQPGGTARCDKMSVQWAIATPAVADGRLVPADPSWQTGVEDLPAKNVTSFAATINTDDIVDIDKCLFVRIGTTHDGSSSFSEPFQVTEFAGALADPTLNEAPTTSSGVVTFPSVTNKSDVPGYLQAYVYAVSTQETSELGIISASAGETVTNTSFAYSYDEAETYAFGLRAVSGDDARALCSEIVWSDIIAAAPPANVRVERTSISDTVRVSWEWAGWASGVVIQWSDNPLAWESNESPDEEIIRKKATYWYISGLREGSTYYFRVALASGSGDAMTVGLFSSPVLLSLSSAPSEPVLTLPKNVVLPADRLTATWSYVSTDGTPQASADIVLATFSDNAWAYGPTVATAAGGQSAEISVEELSDAYGWESGRTYFLAVRTTSESGHSSAFSAPVSLTLISEAPTAALDSPFAASFSYTDMATGDGSTDTFALTYEAAEIQSVTVDGETISGWTLSEDSVVLSSPPADDAAIVIDYTTAAVYSALTAMPMAVTCTGAGVGGTTELRISRRGAYVIDRPDGDTLDGYADEVVFAARVSGEAAAYPITAESLSGRLDDEADYTLTAIITDQYGQTAETSLDFTVHWAHQAWIPTAAIAVDLAHLAVSITPVPGVGMAAGDVCDIYRLSADKPELIVEGGTFGQTYWDPYPAFGAQGGHRIVCRTANGDYITGTGALAWADYGADEGDLVDVSSAVLDFDGERLELPYNLSLENTWAKDFKRTAYLNGAVVGDWNRAVTRDMAVSTLHLRDDEETISHLRALARRPGLCHIRTPEGSSFAADVQIRETQAYNSRAADYSLTISAVEGEGFEGMTAAEYADWISS